MWKLLKILSIVPVIVEGIIAIIKKTDDQLKLDVKVKKVK